MITERTLTSEEAEALESEEEAETQADQENAAAAAGLSIAEAGAVAVETAGRRRCRTGNRRGAACCWKSSAPKRRKKIEAEADTLDSSTEVGSCRRNRSCCGNGSSD